MTLKKKVLQDLETHIPRDAIIASNTSALSITEMATALQQPERMIGMHFFSPVNRMPLVEVIPGDKTDPVTVATVVRLAKALKKTPIVVKDRPGFLVNRILIPYVNEAIRLFEEGVKPLELDRFMTEFGMPIGPLALADEVGLDVGYKVAKILEAGFGTRMSLSPLFDTMHGHNELRGKKTGQGFYIHTGSIPLPNPKLKAFLPARKGKRPKPAECMDRMLLIMVNEAARCLEDEIVQKPDYLDMAMVLGTGFPPFRGGLLRYADSEGISNIVKRLEVLHAACGERFEPAGLLQKMAQNDLKFYSNEGKIYETHR
jgi:3-hydroxyacyl-CoA dehydrogenase/enoyl-CoA hydratase/3-hydroxybutyryl-CoA epimerase